MVSILQNPILLHILYSSKEKKTSLGIHPRPCMHLAVTYSVFFNIQWLPRALPLLTMAFRKDYTGMFVKYPSVWVCLLFLPD